jgi:cation-transporting ATPase E
VSILGKSKKEPAEAGQEPRAQPAVPVRQAPVAEGLTAEEAAQRRAAGLDNRPVGSPTKSEARIVRENVFTFFNLVFAVLAICLLAVGSFGNMAFALIALCNTAIGIVQQIRSKRTVDQLTLLAQQQVPCVRGGKTETIPADRLVRDDIVAFSAGDQICADALVREGELQVNESLITGEADLIPKKPGDTLHSGSFAVSGRCHAQLTRVGADSFAGRLTLEAKRNVTVVKSEMMRSLDGLIRVIGIVLVPMGVILFVRQYTVLGLTLRDSVEATVAALIGMIPEGLYLLTSVALSVSMVRLAGKKVLTRDMNCIETLARVDVLCVDKTGTITEPDMSVQRLVLLDSKTYPEAAVREMLAAFYAGEPENDTARAAAACFANDAVRWRRLSSVPFDSARKWSAVTFAGHGSFVAGAPEFVLGEGYAALRSRVEPYQAQGSRVLLVAGYDGTPDAKTGLAGPALHPAALIVLENRIRPEAPDTFRYFAQQGVAVKVISGDNPVTVSTVAARAGIPGAERFVDASALKTKAELVRAADSYTVFGRVTPDQKRTLVKALQAAGHTVAMTGDGVNDVLALKDADCGIAMASGAQAAAQVAQLVLLDSNFACLPDVVAEGRRVINNIERSAALYLVKNIFSFLLSLISVFVTMPYPLQPLQLTLISFITIGVPSFVLAFEPNHERISGRFLRVVLRRAFPGGLANLGLILGLEAFAYAFALPNEALYTIATAVVTAVGLLVLYDLCRPFNTLRTVLMSAMTVLALLCAAAGSRFGLTALDLQGALILAVFVLLAEPAMRAMLGCFDAGDRAVAWLGAKRCAWAARHKKQAA